MKELDRKGPNSFLWFFILTGVLLRLVGITRPLLGNFGDYQAAQAMVSQFFIENHFKTLLYPQINVLVGGSPSLVLLFFPVASLIAAVPFAFFGGSLDFWGRLQAVLFFAGSAYVLYRLVEKLIDSKIARAALVVFCFSPLTVIYGQSFLNEMSTVFFSLLFFDQLLRFLEKNNLAYFSLSALSLTLVLLMRPNALYLALPALYLGSAGKGKMGDRLLKITGVGLMGLILPGLWYFHLWKLSRVSTHIYMSIFPQLEVRSTFLSPVIFNLDFYLGLLRNLAGVTFTPLGLVLLIIGLGNFKKSGERFFFLWGVAFLLSSFLMPRKLIDHNFYLLHLVVAWAPLIGIGFYKAGDRLMRNKNQWKWVTPVFLALSFVISVRYAAHPAFKTPTAERSTLSVARKLAELTDKSKSRVIVQGTRTYLYYADRYGWNAFVTEKIEELADYYRLTNWQNLSPEEWKQRNEARKDPMLYLEYLRGQEKATHFLVTDTEKFYGNSQFAEYVRKRYPLLYEEKGACLIFQLAKSS